MRLAVAKGADPRKRAPSVRISAAAPRSGSIRRDKPPRPIEDAGNNVTGVPVDQRGAGFARVSGANVDIGAFEFDLSDLIFADDFD